MSLTLFAERLNRLLYRQHIRKLTPAEIELARQWSLNLIRREHPELSEEQVQRFYDNLIHVKFSAVDEWSERMN